MKKGTRTMSLVVGEREWTVNMLYSDTKVSLSGGWARFAKDNDLSAKDVCEFELIEQRLMKVTIFRQAG